MQFTPADREFAWAASDASRKRGHTDVSVDALLNSQQLTSVFGNAEKRLKIQRGLESVEKKPYRTTGLELGGSRTYNIPTTTNLAICKLEIDPTLEPVEQHDLAIMDKRRGEAETRKSQFRHRILKDDFGAGSDDTNAAVYKMLVMEKPSVAVSPAICNYLLLMDQFKFIANSPDEEFDIYDWWADRFLIGNVQVLGKSSTNNWSGHPGRMYSYLPGVVKDFGSSSACKIATVNIAGWSQINNYWAPYGNVGDELFIVIRKFASADFPKTENQVPFNLKAHTKYGTTDAGVKFLPMEPKTTHMYWQLSCIALPNVKHPPMEYLRYVENGIEKYDSIVVSLGSILHVNMRMQLSNRARPAKEMVPFTDASVGFGQLLDVLLKVDQGLHLG